MFYNVGSITIINPMNTSHPLPTIAQKPAFSVVGLLINAIAKSPDIPRLWDQLVTRMGEMPPTDEPRVSYGLMDHFEHTTGRMDYMAGNPVKPGYTLPPGMSHWDIPENTYAVFETTLVGTSNTFDYIFATWLPISGYRQAAAPYFER